MNRIPALALVISAAIALRRPAATMAQTLNGRVWTAIPTAADPVPGTPHTVVQFAAEDALTPALAEELSSRIPARLAGEPDPPVPLPHLPAMDLRNQRVDGFRGIWYTQEQFTEYGDKYSGGLGTYTAKHRPLAVYSAERERTYFVYGGHVPLPTTTLSSETAERYLVPMIASYDHAAHRVSQPVIVHDSGGVNDPHNNPSLAMDEQGHLFVFVAGRATGQPGYVYKSVKPHSIDTFELLWAGPMNSPQPWSLPGGGFFLNFTQYTAGRELYFSRSDDGRTWSRARRITFDSPVNHKYVRRPLGATDPFFAFWADGNPTQPSPSRLFFTNSTGDQLYMLPYTMDTDYAEPVLLDAQTPCTGKAPND